MVQETLTDMTEIGIADPTPVLDLGPSPSSRREWLRALWEHRGVIWVLSRKDFQARYKRASLGVLWAIIVPLLQAVVMAFVFSHFVHTRAGLPYGAYVLSGVLFWSYFNATLLLSTGSIVDGTNLTDKLWFPRAVLPIVPCASGLVGLAISSVVVLVGAPVLGATVGFRVLLLMPACLLLVAFTVALSFVLSALQVYYRDVRFIAAAILNVWLYATPIMYPQTAVGSLGRWLDFNPMTGVVDLFRLAVVGSPGPWARAVIVSVLTTFVLALIGLEAQRRYDRLFVDLL
jgi:lipopolysaccharide transport system permease protein